MTPEVFLADIRENPEDDTPRLVFADWLADHGEEERGEFIRAQVRGEEARLPEASPDLPGISWGDHERGFVEQVTAETAEAFLQNAEAILAAAPVFRLKLERVDGSFAALCDSPILEVIRELDVGNRTGLTGVGVSRLVLSPRASNLRSLLIHQNPIRDLAFHNIILSPHLGKLRDLHASGIHVSDAAIIGFWPGALQRLELLDLRDNVISQAGAAVLARSGGSLRTLWLVNNPVGDEGARAFAEACPPALRCLDLSHCGITDAGARALAGSPLINELEEIALRGNTFRPETWAMLRAKLKEKLRE
ncbi:MAG: TIGR02996 domain-containing protein [Gemmataceae bacterium]|nr:TIGR02996 domain-containing protein [Gemmataceae bacterium]